MSVGSHEDRGGFRCAPEVSALVSATGMPWRFRNHAARVLFNPYHRLLFAISGVRWGSGWRVFGAPVVQRHRQSDIRIGRRLALRSTLRSNPLAPAHPVVLSTRTPEAEIQIGDDFGMTGGSIIAYHRIEIGDRVLVGANCVIIDNDFHPMAADERRREIAAPTAPVFIGDDVFVGTNSIILKGVTVGARSVIGAGSVVTTVVPPDVIVAGNPARMIRSLND